MIHKDLETIASPFKGILLDAYGVFWGGNGVGVLPGCESTMRRLVDEGKILGVLSNTTQPAGLEIEKVAKKGLLQGTHFHFFITSGDVANATFQSDSPPFDTPHKKFFLLGESHPKYASHTLIFNGTVYEETKNIEEADFIYPLVPHIGGIDQTDPSVFEERVERVTQMREAHTLPMLCVNPDRFAHEGNPPKAVVRQGSIADMYKRRGGTVYCVGKPSPLMYSAAMKAFLKHGITSVSEILMVGDTPETDIRGANQFGMHSCLILHTGILKDRIHKMPEEEILSCFSEGDRPDFLIERMGKI